MVLVAVSQSHGVHPCVGFKTWHFKLLCSRAVDIIEYLNLNMLQV